MQYTDTKRLTGAQRTNAYLTKKAVSGGGGTNSRGANLHQRWGDRFKPPKDHSTKIRLIPGAYRGFDGGEYEFGQYVEFYSARARKSFVSGAKWEMVDGNLSKVSGDCLGWDEYSAELEQGIDREDRSISMRVMHVYTVLHLEDFHMVPVVLNGKTKLHNFGKDKGKPILDHELCLGRKCPMCKDRLPKVFGKRCHWSMGFGHLTTLAGYRKEIARDCTNCEGSGTIEEISYDCGGCGKVVVDVDKFDLKDEADRKELDSLTSSPYKCKCGHDDYLFVQHECSGCQDPTPLSIFDCDLEIKSVGENTQSNILIPRWTAVELPADLKSMAKPYDFSQVFQGDPLDIQAMCLKVRNPYGNKESGSHSRDYGSKEDTSKEESSSEGRVGRRRRSSQGEDRANYK